MNTEQAYINGFVKRASEYGFSSEEALEFLKSSEDNIVNIDYPGGYQNALNMGRDAAKVLGQGVLNAGKMLGRGAESAAHYISDLEKANPNMAMGYAQPRVRIPVSGHPGNVPGDPGHINMTPDVLREQYAPLVSAAKSVYQGAGNIANAVGSGVQNLGRAMAQNPNALTNPGQVYHYNQTPPPTIASK